MKIIDSHQHFWQYDPQIYDWIDDSMNILKQNYLPADLESIYKKNEVDGCVVVQARTDLKEIDFLLDIASKNYFVKGVVGWLDFLDNQFEKQLEQYTEYSNLKGLRHVVQAEPLGFLDRKDFQAGLKLLQKYNLVYDILIFPPQLEESIRLVKNLPNQIFVLDHIAKPYIKKQDIGAWEKDIKRLAQLENVYCKISGMVTEADWENWQLEDFRPYLDVVTAGFGANRLLYGSDWPVCLLAAEYHQVMDIVKNYFSNFTSAEKENIFGKNAFRVYGLDPHQ